ncbi:MAG: leucine-rich repeat domain-containing protein [Dehalococcoidia bacterium]|nr:leucine-rich repeat domain-containing protein [Dehalococcoidia bacterium]
MKTVLRRRHPYSIVIGILCMAVVLIVPTAGCGLTEFEVTFSSTAGGSVTSPGEGTFYYQFDEEVSLVATPESGYRFVSWGGGAAPIADVTSASTTITSVQGNYEIRANFELAGPAQYTLTISSTAGGSVTSPGEGTFTSEQGTVVDLTASPAAGYRFVNWTGNVGTVANSSAASTTITMNGNYSITANFEAIPADQYSLTISSTAGGSVTTPGEGTFARDQGAQVSLVATAATGYRFVDWTGNVGTIANANAASTTITMNGNYSITANFEAEPEDGVNFPDANLEATIRTAIGKPTGPIFPSDLEALIGLDARGKNIENLTGLEYCINLEVLFLVDNQISNLSPLAGLSKLERLFLGSNQISDISPLAGLTNLTELGLWHNQITTVTHLKDLTKLSRLMLRGNQISDISPLVQNAGLGTGDYVDLRDNPLSSASINTYIPQLQGRGVEVDF